jgi:hypothetical protein
VSSANPNRAAITAREWSSRNANKYVLRPPTCGPCNASPVQISLGRVASNRPNTSTGLGGGACSSRRSKWRCKVRSDGDHPDCARRILAPCVAVRPRFSFFTAAARSRTSAGVRGGTRAGCGTRAANPPVRHHRHHRSIVLRATRTFSPNGPSCSWAANARTIGPRWRVDSVGSITSWISS